MVQHLYYPSEAEQAAALKAYDEKREKFRDYITSLHSNHTINLAQVMVLEQFIDELSPKGTHMRYDVTIPVGKVDKTTDNRGQVVGIPSFNEAEKFIGLDDEELKKIIDSFTTDTATGQMVIIERVYR